MVLSSFIVSKEGYVNKIQILKGPSSDLKQEVQRVLNLMAENKTWTPGAKDGDNVNVSLTLPIKFKLD